MSWLDVLPRELREELDAFTIEVWIQRRYDLIYIDVHTRYGKFTCVQSIDSLFASLLESFKPDPSCTFGLRDTNVILRDNKVWLMCHGTRLELCHSEGVAVIGKLRYGVAQLE